MDLLPSFLAFLAAALFGFSVHIQNRGLDDTDPTTGAFLSVATTAVLFWLFSPFVVEKAWWLTSATLTFLIAGLVFPALGQNLQIMSIRRVGPSITSAFGSFTPIFAITIAVLALGEAFGLRASFGLALMTLSLILATVRTKGFQRNWPIWALALPLGAAALRGVIQPVMKIGFASVNSPFFATMIMATVSTLVLVVLLSFTGQLPRPSRLRSGSRWFALSGVLNGLGILSLSAGISTGNVSIVAPLAATTPLWTLAFGAFIFKRETLGLRHLLIAALAVIGAVLIVSK